MKLKEWVGSGHETNVKWAGMATRLNGPEGGTVRRLTWLGSVHSLYLSLQHAQERFLVRSKVMKFVLGGGKAVLSVKGVCVCVCGLVSCWDIILVQ